MNKWLHAIIVILAMTNALRVYSYGQDPFDRLWFGLCVFVGCYTILKWAFS